MVDINYWDNFYKQNNILNKNNPSNFCLFVLDYFKNNKTILNVFDAGCGNGRDSYTLSLKYNVTGVDISSQSPENIEKCNFYIDNFCTYNKNKFDMIYSRFTFHSITNENHNTFLQSITRPGTYLCIETRSDKGKNSFRYFKDGHYRNFTNLKYITDLLNKYRFDILYIEENNNFAIYKEENPICIRIICKKK